MATWEVIQGDCLEVLSAMPENSIDSIVTDPPAGISFMGKGWDSDKGGRDKWIEWMASIACECRRVLKPGGYALVWSLPRTSHWTAMAWENAGFEPRDQIIHIFGSGFPKSLDIGKAIDKAAGAEHLREFVSKNPADRPYTHTAGETSIGWKSPPRPDKTAPATDAAKQWDGWGTALKPAHENWWLFRKSLSEKTVAANVLKHGTGGLNVGGCRVEGVPRTTHAAGNCVTTIAASGHLNGKKTHGPTPAPTGRFPANLILTYSEDEYTIRDSVTPEQLESLADWLRANPEH